MCIIRLLNTCVIAVFLLCAAGFIFAQSSENAAGDNARGSVPEELMRPRRDESPRYAIDTVIGPLGRGSASRDAYTFASQAATSLLAGNKDAPSLSAASSVLLETYISALEQISPQAVRLGGGIMEDDGAVSFLVRFIGREQAITGELFIRMKETEAADDKPAQQFWVFEDLLLDEAQSREEETEKGEPRFDFSPYERFF